ncbi:hypothetical protein PPERSA_02768 [Pseudocohnilembus persalinus]|uniref:Uncharacterized protein n=1 Tax=Pseudocohnilembus persalinus TaxID=266149 RepID=A0A0V0Q8Q3_PSEPJ|nr:hypothetical protein PPERSA_02768 [Pseudocohnilembus persalinus]|eukprot:KRW98620.1 hypothetical protein PPERSA_02768 [Pseudocohnilembus persalinus]
MKYKDIKLKLEEQLEKNMEINLQTQEYKKQSEKLADSFREIIMRNSEKIKKLMANKNSKLVKKFLEIGEKQGKIIKMGKQQFKEFLEYFWDQNVFIKEKYLSCFIFGQIIWWQQKLILVKDLELITKVIASKSCSNKEELENSKEIMDFQNYIQRLRFYNQRVRKSWEKNMYSKMCQNRKNQELLVNQSGRICIQGCLFIKKMLKISHDFVNLDALNIKAWEDFYKNLNKKYVQQKMESQYKGDEFKSCLNLKNVNKKSSSLKKIQEFQQESGNNILSTIISVCESLEEEQEQDENKLQNKDQFNKEFQFCYQNKEICKNYDENMFDIEKNQQIKQDNHQSEVNMKSNTNVINLFDEQKIERSESFEDLVNTQNYDYNEDHFQIKIDNNSNITKNNLLDLAIFSRSSLNNPVSTFNNIYGDCDELSFNETSFEEISMV